LAQATQMHIVVTVKAYPAVSTSYGEVVCIAGFALILFGPSG